MFTKNSMLAFVVIIFNVNIIYSESKDYELPEIDYSYIRNDDSEPNISDQNIYMLALNSFRNEIQDILEKTLTRKLELLENSAKNKIKEVIANDSAIQQTATIQAIANDSAIRQTAIANLTNVVQAMSQKLSNFEYKILELQTQLENCTALKNNSKGNEKNTSDSRLLHVTVPSSVHARTDVWKDGGTPDIDDIDLYMTNVTGCQYMAAPSYDGNNWRPVSNSSGSARWRWRIAVRGEKDATIRVTKDGTYDYRISIGYNSNTQTQVVDGIQNKYLLRRASPGVMSRERYTQFHFIQLEDGVLSFGAVGDSPWWRDNVTMSAGDVLRMEYTSDSSYGGKLLVCA